MTSECPCLPSAPAAVRSANNSFVLKTISSARRESVHTCECADLCQSLCEAGRLGLWESQEEGLLPQRPQCWNITLGGKNAFKATKKLIKLTQRQQIFPHHSFPYRSLQMQMIGRSRIGSLFFFFFAVSVPASPPCPSFLFRTANSMFMAACRAHQRAKH